MSYIRFNEPRTYFDGESNAYIYPTGGPEGGSSVACYNEMMTERDLAEVALRVVRRSDLDDDTFEEVVEAVTEEYPQFDE